jgi:hypothetical protein
MNAFQLNCSSRHGRVQNAHVYSSLDTIKVIIKIIRRRKQKSVVMMYM